MSRDRPRVGFPVLAGGGAAPWILVAVVLGYALLVLPGSVAELSAEIASSGLRGLLRDARSLGLILAVLAVSAPVFVAARRTRWAAAGASAVLGASVVLGVVFGAVGAVVELRANEYLGHGMRPLALDVSGRLLQKLLLVGIASGLLALAGVGILSLLARLRGREGVGDWVWALPLVALVVAGSAGIHQLLPAQTPVVLRAVSYLLWAGACGLVGWLVRRRLGALGESLGWLRSGLAGTPTVLAALALVVGVVLAPRVAGGESPTGRSNLVLISLDTLRADHLGLYGYERPTSPNLDAFARDGVVFRRAFSAAPWTLPSHMTMLTGLYPSRHGAVTKFNRLARHFVLLSEILRNEGYATMAVTDGGFLSEHYGYDGFEVFDEGSGVAEKGGMTGQVANRVDRAIELLEQRSDRPFFLFLHTYQIHCPYEPPARFDLFSDPGYDGPVEVEGQCVEYYRQIQDQMGKEDYRYVAAKYDGLILYSDAELRRLFDYLEDSGLLGNSLVVVTSDHGENIGDHPQYQLGHSELYDHAMHVPLILRGPGLPAGLEIEQPVEGVDLMPTLLDLLDLSWKEPTDGRSLADLIAGGEWRKPWVFGEKFPTMRMVRSARWKLIQHSPGELELFDLEADPREKHSLIGEAPRREERLHAILDQWGELQDRRLEEISQGQEEVPEALQKKLEALGYVG